MPSSPRLAARPPVEPLEPRRMFAAAVVRAGVLTVTATPAVDNTVRVGFSADLSFLVVTDAWQTGRGRHLKPHLFTDSFPISGGITSVRIFGGSRGDDIRVDQTYSTFLFPTQIHGGGGNDTIYGGDGPDSLTGDAGNDLIYGLAGNDTLYGQHGNDSLIGGPGDDFLSGRRGRDSLEGDDGNDTLLDPFGPDTVLGGAGDNTFEIHALKTDKVNDYNVTKDTLQIVSIPDRTTDDDDDGFLGGLLPITSLL